MQPIPVSLLDTPVDGVNLAGRAMRDQLAAGDTLLVFLRHFG